MERKGIILEAKNMVRKEEDRNQAKQKGRAATNTYRTKQWYFL